MSRHSRCSSIFSQVQSAITFLYVTLPNQAPPPPPRPKSSSKLHALQPPRPQDRISTSPTSYHKFAQSQCFHPIPIRDLLLSHTIRGPTFHLPCLCFRPKFMPWSTSWACREGAAMVCFSSAWIEWDGHALGAIVGWELLGVQGDVGLKGWELGVTCMSGEGCRHTGERG